MSDDESETTSHLIHQTAESRRREHEESDKESHRSHWLFLALLVSVVVVVAVMVAVGLGVGLTRSQRTSNLPSQPGKRAEALLAEYPVIDGSVQ